MMEKIKAVVASRGEGRGSPGKRQEETFLSGGNVLHLSRGLSYAVTFVKTQHIYN